MGFTQISKIYSLSSRNLESRGGDTANSVMQHGIKLRLHSGEKTKQNKTMETQFKG